MSRGPQEIVVVGVLKIEKCYGRYVLKDEITYGAPIDNISETEATQTVMSDGSAIVSCTRNSAENCLVFQRFGRGTKPAGCPFTRKKIES